MSLLIVKNTCASFPGIPGTASQSSVMDGRSRERSRSRERHADGRRSARRSRSRSRSPRGTRAEEPRRRDSRSPRRKELATARPRTDKRAHWFAKEYDPVQVGSIDGTDTVPHDKALVRAQRASFDASRDPLIHGNPYATLFVGRLNYATTEETLQRIFQQYGRTARVRLVRDRTTHQSKGYAFVEFEDERAFRDAYHAAHRQQIDGHTILVDYERGRVMPGWKPRRLGGGLGGKKESGQLRFGGRDRPFKPPR